ncbi:MAG: hypothetical protein AMJ43_04555 [Coxiella sp. DG_40]|nr:MAG: hypothetical protein AMJ43_04555 [Coxiella sp. DG_40]
MSKKIGLAIFLSFLFLIVNLSAFAALSKSSGYYAEGNVGIRDHQETALIGNVGYKLNNNFGIEGGVAFLAKIYFDIAAKAILPLDRGFEAFGKAGITQHVYFYGGLGLGYVFTPNISVTAQGILIAHDSGKYAATLGLTYIF